MSFETLKKDELLKIAEEFGTDVQPNDNKATIIAALTEDGVTYAQAQKFVAGLPETAADEPAEQPAAIVDERPKALLRMNRENGTYQIRGVTFKKTHPFALMAEDDAEWVVENVEGFRYATPREAAEFYG